jgi:hypothetical protein
MSNRKKKQKELLQRVQKVIEEPFDVAGIAAEIFDCEDADALLEKHLADGIEAVHANVTIMFAAILMERYTDEEPTEVPPHILQYLEKACRLLGLHNVANAFAQGIDAALTEFQNAPPDLDDKAIKNAKALNLLVK